jgi:hypothetical protein
MVQVDRLNKWKSQRVWCGKNSSYGHVTDNMLCHAHMLHDIKLS